MKKFGKFIFGTVALASVAAGAYYVYKNFIKKDSSDEFDDFEDDFEDFDTEEESEQESSREYVPINITPDDKTAAAENETTEEFDEEEAPEEEV